MMTTLRSFAFIPQLPALFPPLALVAEIVESSDCFFRMICFR